MMKHVFALLALLHLCCSYADIDMNLNAEIFEDLKKLHNLKTINITSPLPLRVPVADGNTHVSCLAAFAKELMHLLNNVSVPEDKKGILRGLKQNLRLLNQQHKETDHKCRFGSTRNATLVFWKYLTFLRTLNNNI